MDMNVILDLTTLLAKSDYSSTFEPALQTANVECTIIDFSALGINIEKLREKMGGHKCDEDEDEDEEGNYAWIWWVVGFVICIIIGICVYK